jgi:hypothetical protein
VLPFRLWAPLIAALLLLSGCGGAVNTTPLTPQPANGSGTATSNAQVTVPPAGALSAGTVTLPTVTAGSGASLSIRTMVGSAATSSTERTAESITNSTAFAEVVITANSAVTFTGAFVASITYAGGPTTYYGTFQDQNGNLSTTPSQTASGTTYTLTSPSGTYVLAAGQSVTFDFAASQTPGATTVISPVTIN